MEEFVMSKIIELRNKRNTLWEQTKAFLEDHRDSNGLVEASAVEQYNKMAADVKALGEEIKRLEDQMEMDAKLSAATSAPVHADPKAGQRKGNVRPTATNEYNDAFWNMMRGMNTMEVRDALSVGVDQNGGFTVPDEFERQLIQALEENNIFRSLAKTIHTNSGTRTIPIATDSGSASWI
jgi:HK97 family phage major capsid protein